MILDAFAGPGGWDEGLRAAGLTGVIGIEHDHDANRTAMNAGHHRVEADVATFPLDHLRGNIEGLVMSPPCTDFSIAGKRAGIDGATGSLIREVGRWVTTLRPEWFACEQVPPALPYWVEYAYTFERLGYRCWSGVLNSADYGVPQTRWRAILVGSLRGPVSPPVPSHSRDGGGLFSAARWVTMADALGWGAEGTPSATVTAKHDEPVAHWSRFMGTRDWVVRTRGDSGRDRDEFDATVRPSRAVTGKTDSWILDRRQSGAPTIDTSIAPAPTVVGTALSKGVWTVTRPATTIQCDQRVFQPGGHHTPGAQSANAIRISVQDALILQSFRSDYPLHGTKTSQFRQVGNAIPPLLAQRIVEQFKEAL